ncbi:hypothetical protein AALO_G00289150 [Alosa alosa]|uniref:Uncharacterized protein n=1 Tax=Alosa alosa TaxID=278164 RepID=A0AAV6FGB2_9TELE|nr:hypothetical protein AALO_G00289150 [Alosa alosa]
MCEGFSHQRGRSKSTDSLSLLDSVKPTEEVKGERCVSEGVRRGTVTNRPPSTHHQNDTHSHGTYGTPGSRTTHHCREQALCLVYYHLPPVWSITTYLTYFPQMDTTILTFIS